MPMGVAKFSKISPQSKECQLSGTRERSSTR